MDDLKQLRDQIDEIDDQIVKLYEKRMAISGDVAGYKIKHGKKVIDRTREKDKIAAVTKKATSGLMEYAVEELFQHIMATSRKLQYQLLTQQGALGKLPFIEIDDLDARNSRIVFQGVEGANSEAAMKKYFGSDINSYHVETFRDAMEAIEEGAADYAVLPIDNSSAGAVNEVYDLLVEFENYIVAEQIIKIEHVLMGLPGTNPEEIERVYSHPQALMQCADYLDDHRNWQPISNKNTAIAAKKIKDDGDKKKAAIASPYAAEAYGLEILEDNISNSTKNSTRFIIVTNQKVFLKNAGKITICLELPHKSGSLYQLLSHFIYNNLNMTKIESRPIPDQRWEYRFFIDIEGNLADSGVKNAIRGLREEARNMKILGNY